ncbi:phosphatidylethanolamine-binding protein 4 isoform X2 [Dromiciops gliroides]|uniref:phosphatidylethanolamine-binding protein 4 isoform X2 n=1 Tax=Dromiciops gliroides TaxID=33562 RepID=UPI001CC7D804|nr:phosphatidylethanolamine-binding protein 4 isoform X2 [Dromiciops gliroides]
MNLDDRDPRGHMYHLLILECAMKLLVAVILMLGLMVLGDGQPPKNEDRTCVYQKLSQEDALFCKDQLNVIYPEIGDIGCLYVPECNNFRQKIGSWGKPSIKYSQAQKNKKYVLMMVDPDAPSRNYPQNRYWRHWLLINISGNGLKTGNINGHELTSYQPPGPPPKTGFHRYQFLLFEQPEKGKPITLSSKEKAKRGSWSISDFIKHFHLGSPVAASQFLTQNYRDF